MSDKKFTYRKELVVMIKMRKQAASLLLAIAMVCSVTACREKTSDGAAAATAHAEATEEAGAKAVRDIRVGICIYDAAGEYMTLYQEELKRVLINEYGISDKDIITVHGNGDQLEQNRQIDHLIDQEADVMIMNLIQPSETGGVVDKCREAGIPAVLINREPEEEEISRWEEEGIAAAYVGADGKQSGIYQGEIILETTSRGDFNRDGTISYVMITGDPKSRDTKERSEYSIKALEQAGMKTELLLEESGDWDREKGKEIAAGALARYGRKVEVIFCNNDAMALGAKEAVLEAGRTVGRDICLVGVDALEEAVSSIQEGQLTGTVLNDYAGQSRAAAAAAMKMMEGEKTDTKYIIDYVKVAMDQTMAALIAAEGKPKSIFDTSTGEREFTVGIAVHEFRDNFMRLYRTELETYLTDTYQARVTVADGAGNQEEQVRQVREFISQGVDVLILNLVQAAAAPSVADICKEAGIPVIFINCEPEEEEIERWMTEGIPASYVGIGEDQLGIGFNDYDSQAHLAADLAAQMAAGRVVEAEYNVQ